jgi:hypothetical protein
MSLAEIKELIHEQVENSSDPDVLRLVNELLARDHLPRREIYLTTEQQQALDKSSDDRRAGRTIARNDAAQQVHDWLQKNP